MPKNISYAVMINASDLINYEKVILISNQNFANILSIISCFNLKRVKTVLFERNHLSELDNNWSLKLKVKNGILKLCIKFLDKIFIVFLK